MQVHVALESRHLVKIDRAHDVEDRELARLARDHGKSLRLVGVEGDKV